MVTIIHVAFVGRWLLTIFFRFCLSSAYLTYSVMRISIHSKMNRNEIRFIFWWCFLLSRSESLLSPQRAKLFLAFLWTFNVAIICPIFVWNRPIHGRCNKRVFYPIHYYFILSTAVVAIIVTTVLYTRLFCVAWRHRLAIRALDLAAGSSAYVATAKKEAKLTKTGGMIIGLLYASWLPYVISNVLFGNRFDIVSRVQRHVVFIILSANSMINPIIYQWRIPEFHTAFRKLMPFLGATHTQVDTTWNSFTYSAHGDL